MERWEAVSLGRPPASTDTAVINGGSDNIGTSAITVAGLTQSGGTISGSSTLTVKGAATFSGAAIQTGTGTTVLDGTSQLNGTLYLEGGRVLENAGILTLLGGGIELDPGTFQNEAGAKFLIESNSTAVGLGTGTGGFTNSGLVEKEASTGTSTQRRLYRHHHGHRVGAVGQPWTSPMAAAPAPRPSPWRPAPP